LMSRVLVEDEQIPRRTLVHDMESFFSVIIWIATLDYENEAAFHATPLAVTLLDRKKTPLDIVQAKMAWFDTQNGFRKMVIGHFQPFYREDNRFITCLSELRRILYPDNYLDNDSKGTGNADLMKEGIFRMCMKEID